MSIIKTYDYCDEHGAILYRNVRLEKHDAKGVRLQKTFFQQRIDPARKGGWINGLEGVRRVPYRLPELTQRAGQDVHIAEGEKDADRLEALGLCATSIADPNTTELKVFAGRNVFPVRTCRTDWRESVRVVSGTS
jgi:hypothetical protein